VVWPVIEACLEPDPRRRPGADVIAGRLRGVEPALDGMEALPTLPAESVTWWPRPASAATATASVSPAVAWVPMVTAPVSPASAYAGRMTAIPVAGVEGVGDVQVPVISGPHDRATVHSGSRDGSGSVASASVADGPLADGPVTDGPVTDGPPADRHIADGSARDDAPVTPVATAPVTPLGAAPGRTGRRGRRIVLRAGLGAGAAVLAAVMASTALLPDSATERGPASQPEAVPGTGAPAADPSAVLDQPGSATGAAGAGALDAASPSAAAPGSPVAAAPGAADFATPGSPGAPAAAAGSDAAPGSAVEPGPGRAAGSAPAVASPTPGEGTAAVRPGVLLVPGTSQLPGIGDPMPKPVLPPVGP
jgi:hypothetical protein